MTVSSTTNKHSYNGNGAQAAYAYTFKIFADADISVYVGTALQSLNTHYTLSGVGSSSGGNVTFTSGNIPASGTGNVTLLRSLALTQGVDLINYGKFDAEVIEAQYDKLVMMVQQLQEQADRTIRFSTTVSDAGGVEITDTVAQRSGKVLAYDASGDLSVADELGEWQGNWATTTAYVARDLVMDSATSNVYICLVAHTAGTLSSDVTASKWALVVDASAVATSATNAATSATASASSATASASSATTSTTKASESSTSATNAATSATTATTQASTATTKASEASTSATNASTSETNSATSATNSATSASGSATSATAAASSASTATTKASEATTNGAAQVALATTQAGLATTNGAAQVTLATAQVTLATTQAGLATTNGAAQVTLATTQANTATTQASTATTQANTATTKASEAATSATNAATSATGSATSATASSNSATAAAASLATFQGQYHGSSASAPSSGVDSGDMYFNSTSGDMKVYNGASWQTIAPTVTTVNNDNWSGADLEIVHGGTGASSASAARTNLSLVVGTDVLAPDGDGSSLTGLAAGGNVADFVASGTLPNGKPVVLKADGTVEVVGLSAVSQSIPAGSEYVFNSGSRARNPAIAFDPNNTGKFVVAFRDYGNSSYSTALVGTVSGTTISFGSETVFYSGPMGPPSIAFDPNTANKFVIAYQDEYNSGTGTELGRAIVGTVSGTSLSFGSAVTFHAGSLLYTSLSFDPNTSGQFAVAYTNVSSSDDGTLIIGTLSGTSVSFGSSVVFCTPSSCTYPTVSYDLNTANKLVVTYRGANDYGTARVGTVSGTTPSFGTEVVFASDATTFPDTSADKTTGKFLTAYYADGNAKAIVGTVSGTSISFGSAVIFNADTTYKFKVAGDPLNAGKFVINYIDGSDSNYAKTIVCSVTNTTPSFGTAITIVNSNSYSNAISSEFDPINSGKFVTVYEDAGNSEYGTAAVGQTAVSVSNLTSTNFLGSSTAAYTNGQTASIALKGGLSTNQSGLTADSTYYVQTDGTLATTAGSPSVEFGKAVNATTVLIKDNDVSLPTQTGNSGKFLTTDGSATSWGEIESLPTQTGHTGEFLTTNGSTASWGEAGGGAWTLVSTTSVSSASTIDITSFTDYKKYRIVFDITCSSNHYMKWKLKINGGWGSTYYSYSATRRIGSNSTETLSSSSNSDYGHCGLTWNETLNSTSLNWEWTLSNPTESAKQQTSWKGYFIDTYGYVESAVGIGNIRSGSNSSGILQGLRLYPSTGTFSGKYYIYGLTSTEI